MENNKDSISNTFQVAGALCIVCSLLVSITAVGLRETQKNNVVLDKKKNILLVSGFSAEEVAKMDPAQIESYFAEDGDEVIQIEDTVIDLTTGETAGLTVRSHYWWHCKPATQWDDRVVASMESQCPVLGRPSIRKPARII